MTDDPYGNEPTRRYPPARVPSGREPQEGMRLCPRCGTQVTRDTQFCPNCGEDLRPQKASRAPIWIACILAVLLAAAIVGLIAESSKKSGHVKTVTKHVKGPATHNSTTNNHTTTVVKTHTVAGPTKTVTRPAKTVTVTHTTT
jgi:predicted nucleic acid-binding Zn ribbon protein